MTHSKHVILLSFILVIQTIFFPFSQMYAQTPGQWAWEKGSDTSNYIGNFGTQGVADAANQPPGLYEACEWTDLDGNFWLYGGNRINAFSDDLWKYDPVTATWTWVRGHNSPNNRAVYGIQGIPSPVNSPGLRTTSYSWVDHNGDLWLYGGLGYYDMNSAIPYSDLWRYNIATNMWTWMKGDSGNSIAAPHYGSKGVEAPSNRPGAIDEMGIAWTSGNNDLWLLDYNGCLWKYRIATNSWTWMKGDTILYPAPIYGTKGVAAPNNTPGYNYFSYTRWKDHDNNLWYLEGGRMILWKYSIASNMWTWVNGDTTDLIPYYGPMPCDHEDDTLRPQGRAETRACWLDGCDNLWLMGGHGPYTSLNDLLYYDMSHDEWVWVDNDTTLRDTSIYGTLGSPGVSNTPSSRDGAVPFVDNAGHLWLFGGINSDATARFGDLWMYTIDTNCTRCHPTGIKDASKTSQVSFYPNPATSEITVNGGQNYLEKVEVYDITGKKILQKEISKQQDIIDLSGLKRGLYFVHLYVKDRGPTISKLMLN